MNFPELFDSINDRPLYGWPWTEETEKEIYAADANWPRLSIITPSYNQGHYLEQTIRSVLLQNYPNLEYIVIDGGSTDQSVEIIQKYGQRIDFWVSEADAGQSEALEKGFGRANGEIAAWINSDDFYEKDAFYKIARVYKETGFTFFCGACQMVDEGGKWLQSLYSEKISYRTLIKYWRPHFCPPQPSVFFKREALYDLGGFDKSLLYSMDFEIWLKASKRYSFYGLKENISYYRIHSNSKTGSPGGLRKFIPEWKMLIERSLRQESFFTKWGFHICEKRFLLYRFVRDIFYKNELKTILRKWLLRRKVGNRV